MVVFLGEMVKQTMKEGKLTDWGTFIDGAKGYGIYETTALDTYKSLQQWAPYFKFNAQEVLSVDDLLKTFKPMMK